MIVVLLWATLYLLWAASHGQSWAFIAVVVYWSFVAVEYLRRQT